MCNEKKDFSLLRPFNEEAAKNGESIYTCHEQKLSYQAGPDVSGTIAVLNERGYMITCRVQDIRMAPLCWVRTSVEDDTLKPVYKGDVLYQKVSKPWRKVVVDGITDCGRYLTFDDAGSWAIDGSASVLVCTPPKVKREVSLLGFINRSTKEVLLREKPLFYDKEFWNRSPQLDTTVEIEE